MLFRAPVVEDRGCCYPSAEIVTLNRSRMHLQASRLNRTTFARNEPGTARNVTCALAAVLLSSLLQPISAKAQTVRIDATPSHVANTFSPLRAMGSTVDPVSGN